VKPHLRGKGIGSALLKHLARLATERRCGRLEGAVLDWNLPSIQFYKKLGVPYHWMSGQNTGWQGKRLRDCLFGTIDIRVPRPADDGGIRVKVNAIPG